MRRKRKQEKPDHHSVNMGVVGGAQILLDAINFGRLRKNLRKPVLSPRSALNGTVD